MVLSPASPRMGPTRCAGPSTVEVHRTAERRGSGRGDLSTVTSGCRSHGCECPHVGGRAGDADQAGPGAARLDEVEPVLEVELGHGQQVVDLAHPDHLHGVRVGIGLERGEIEPPQRGDELPRSGEVAAPLDGEGARTGGDPEVVARHLGDVGVQAHQLGGLLALDRHAHRLVEEAKEGRPSSAGHLRRPAQGIELRNGVGIAERDLDALHAVPGPGIGPRTCCGEGGRDVGVRREGAVAGGVAVRRCERVVRGESDVGSG